ncbi:dihydropteroate synthase [Compostibacter hankyongensis]|uniref:dihydropteroate synthase n=2 Tax=Compostibacter hankyongensis TaxID=1007089 RepID=A0ABP8FMY4_9BACT
MGILNLTDDSFYAGSRYPDEKLLLEKAEEMLSAGAAVLDIGGQSTRPGAALLGAEAEKDKIVPAVRSLLRHFPDALLSVDTWYAEVARAAAGEGAVIINDVSAGEMDADMLGAVAALGVPYIAMHMQGRPATMQQDPHYDDVVRELLDFFIVKKARCREAGIGDLIIDPGFGFGKTLAHNYRLLGHLEDFQLLDAPLAAGVSRKSMIYRLLENTPEEALNGTTALHMLLLQKGVRLLRVHDVKPAMEVIRLWEFYREQQ